MEELKHPGEISVGGAEEDAIGKVAPEGVCREYGSASTGHRYDPIGGGGEKVYTVNEAPVREIRIQRYHDLSGISGPVLVLEVEPLFSAHL